MGIISREFFLLLALLALARSDAVANKTAKKEPTDNFLYQYEDYDVAEDQEEVLFSEDKPCPRDCICTVSQGYRIAKCNRLELGTQKFGDDITDLVLENLDPAYPIELDELIFKKLGLHQISTVKIVNSTIKSINPTAFHGLHELYAVNLSGNKLRTLHPETFANNKKLLLLTLSNNPLKFPAKGSADYFLNSSSVQELDISNSNLQYITGNTFKKMPGLMYLNVAGNSISDMDIDTFKNLPDLEELDLSDNNIKILPDDIFSANTELATLHIQRNAIDTVYGLQIPDLLTLNAGQTKIQFVGPSMFNGMTYIANLNLSGNGIEKIHNQAFHKLIELNYLDLSYNSLDFISSVLIKENIELDIFKISNNPMLKLLPENGFVCSAEQFNIYLFDASNCGLETIPDNALSTFTALSQINLSENKLKSISASVFSRSAKLVEINLSNNLLSTLESKVFAQNKELVKLNLRGNPLKTISSEIFIYTPKLTWLDMSHGMLNSLWEEEKNHPAALLNDLHFLNVSNNNITTIKQSELKSIDKLNSLDISNNPLVCNRDFENLMTWLNEHKVSPAAINANMANLEKDAKEEDQKYSWEFLDHETCKTDFKLSDDKTTSAPASDEEIWQKIDNEQAEDTKELKDTFDDGKVATEEKIDDENDYDNILDDKDDDKDEDEDDEDDDDENDEDIMDLDVKLLDDGTKTIKADKVPKTEDTIQINVELLESEGNMYDDLDGPVYVEASIKDSNHGRYGYLWSILIVVLGVFVLLLVIGKCVMVVFTKRNKQIRYNSAIIAAMSNAQGRTKKDCGLVYQQLSEDLTGPVTPKLSRYAPLQNVTVQASNLSYESSPFHHNNIVPEAV